MLNTVDYTHGRLTANITLPNMTALDALNLTLTDSGLKFEEQISEESNAILVQLIITQGNTK